MPRTEQEPRRSPFAQVAADRTSYDVVVTVIAISTEAASTALACASAKLL